MVGDGSRVSLFSLLLLFSPVRLRFSPRAPPLAPPRTPPLPWPHYHAPHRHRARTGYRQSVFLVVTSGNGVGYFARRRPFSFPLPLALHLPQALTLHLPRPSLCPSALATLQDCSLSVHPSRWSLQVSLLPLAVLPLSVKLQAL
ncbi:hypothetical protein DFH06DRAFT_1348189 [Mycena polygramma]|nr:hypothetical protein DFH06DRAFT_1348189 [Mycena polygramma]